MQILLISTLTMLMYNVLILIMTFIQIQNKQLTVISFFFHLVCVWERDRVTESRETDRDRERGCVYIFACGAYSCWFDVCECTCRCLCMCMLACIQRLKVDIGAIFYCSTHLFLRQILTKMELTDWLVNELPICLPLFKTGVTDVCHCLWLLCGC